MVLSLHIPAKAPWRQMATPTFQNPWPMKNQFMKKNRGDLSVHLTALSNWTTSGIETFETDIQFDLCHSIPIKKIIKKVHY